MLGSWVRTPCGSQAKGAWKAHRTRNPVSSCEAGEAGLSVGCAPDPCRVAAGHQVFTRGVAPVDTGHLPAAALPGLCPCPHCPPPLTSRFASRMSGG